MNVVGQDRAKNGEWLIRVLDGWCGGGSGVNVFPTSCIEVNGVKINKPQEVGRTNSVFIQFNADNRG